MQSAAVKIAERPKHGFEGEALELGSPKDFRGHEDARTLPERENYNSDRLYWLYCHDKINDAQYFAGKKLQADAQLAQIGTFGNL